VDNYLKIYGLIATGVLGAIIGSFMNVCIYRIPRGLSVIRPGSRCPHCKTSIAFYDNIPIISYLILRGRCRHCGMGISPRYPLIETMNTLLYIFLYLKFGLSYATLFGFIFVSMLIVISLIDLDHRIIPDSLSFSGIIIGFLSSFFIKTLSPLQSLLGILVGGGFLFLVAVAYEKIAHKEGMGGGDIKLIAMIGAFTGWQAIPFVILASSLIGALFGVIYIVLAKKDTKFAIPFGPFLSFAAVLYIFFGPWLIHWYLSLGKV